jgi:uncharacterized protein GlcG (DUF336 family)
MRHRSAQNGAAMPWLMLEWLRGLSHVRSSLLKSLLVRSSLLVLSLAGFCLTGSCVQAQPSAVRPSSTAASPALITTSSLSPSTALAAAQAALQFCEAAGFQVAVAVVDRGGTLQVLLRNRLAGAHTVRASIDKAWTAASFRISTRELAEQTQPGLPMSGLRALPQVLAVGGGVPLWAAGSMVGAIGVSGAPGASADESCAVAATQAVATALELGDP